MIFLLLLSFPILIIKKIHKGKWKNLCARETRGQKSGKRIKETNSLRIVGSPWMLDARTQEATKGGNGRAQQAPRCVSFVLISRLLIKPQPPKNKARKGEGEKNGRAGRHFSVCVSIRPRNCDRKLGGDYGAAGYEGRPTKRGRGRELKRMKRQVKREGGKAVLIQPNRNNYGDTHGIRNGGTISIGPLLPSFEEISVVKSHSISRSFTTISQIIIVWRDTKRLSSASCVSPRIQFHAASFKSLCHPR